MRLLAERHDDLTHERTRILNRLHGVLRELVPGGTAVGLSADKAVVILRTIRPSTATDTCRRELARELLGDLRRVDRQLKANERLQRDAVAATGTTLSDVHGIAVVLSAKILGHVGDVTRFPSADHFANELPVFVFQGAGDVLTSDATAAGAGESSLRRPGTRICRRQASLVRDERTLCSASGLPAATS